MATGATTKELILKVDAATELARRNLSDLERHVARSAGNMDTSLAKVDTASTRLGKSFDTLKTASAGLFAAVGVSSIVNVGREILKFADDLGTAADQAGISVERYQTLTEAFRTLELSTEQTDKVLKTLQATLGDVQNGADNSATKALDRLGVSAKIMSGEITTSDQLLDALAATAKTAGSQAQFTADIVDIFGKKVGVDLAAALKDGGAALHQLEADMISTGTVIDREMIAKLADANEAIDLFSGRLRRSLAIAAAEGIGFLERIGYQIDLLNGKLAGGPDEAARARIEAFQKANYPEVVANREGAVREARTRLAGRQRAQGSILGSILSGGQAGVAQAETDLRKAQGELNKVRRLGIDETRARILNPFNIPMIPIPRSGGGGGGGSRRRSTGGGGPRASGGVRSRTARPAKPEASMADLRDAANADAFDPISTLSTGALANLDAISPELFRQMQAEAAELSDILESFRLPNLTQDLTEADRIFAGLKNDLAAGLSDAIVFGEDLGDTLEKTFKRAAAAMIESGILNFLTGGKEGTSFGTMLGNLGSLFGKGAGTPPIAGARALGGPVSAGKAYLVGERGPELFQPRIAGNIVPNGARAGGSSPAFHFDLRGAVVTQDLLNQMNEIGLQAARAGAAIGEARVYKRASRLYL